ncbi:MAG TPA: hypothetical protein VEI02_00645 [Planctomycetota bacterium]|nr:hypothetical protein [Planctomycetota bacterium]
MLEFRIGTRDMERQLAHRGAEAELSVDESGRLEAELKRLPVKGLGRIAAGARFGPLSVDRRTGEVRLPLQVRHVLGVRLGRAFVTRKLLEALAKRLKLREAEIDAERGVLSADVASLLSKLAPPLAGYRVTAADFVRGGRSAEDGLRVVLEAPGAQDA